MHTIFLLEDMKRRPLGRCRRRWKDNIRMDLREIGSDVFQLDVIGSGVGPVADCCEYDNENSSSIKGGKFLD